MRRSSRSVGDFRGRSRIGYVTGWQHSRASIFGPLPATNDPPEKDTLEAELIELHEQMLARDNAFRAWEDRVDALEHDKEQMRQRLEEAAAEIRELSQTIAEMHATRVWRWG
jgi:chromosome segregation ATPase